MADVFVSYVSEDRAIAEKIAGGLLSAGFSVWWDRHIHGGVDFSEEIERQIGLARQVVVLWSSRSRDSPWVRDEASYARDHKKLIPIRIDATEPPLGFRQVQSLDFGSWNGDASSDAFEGLLGSLRASGGSGGGSVPAKSIGRGSSLSRNIWLSAFAGLVVVAVVAAIVMNDRARPDASREAGNSRVEIGTVKRVSENAEASRVANILPETMQRVLATNEIKTIVAASGPEGSGKEAEFVLRQTADGDGKKVIVSADIVHQSEGLVLWSTKLEGEGGDYRALGEQFSIFVADVLRCGLRLRRQANGDLSPELLTKFLRLCEARSDRDQWPQMPELARRIVQAAPEHAISHAIQAEADALCTSTVLTCVPDPSAADLARVRKAVADEAHFAIESDPTIGDAYVALAIVRDAERSIAEREELLLKSLAVDPESRDARVFYALMLGRVGRIRESRAYFERAVNDYPLDSRPLGDAAYLRAAMGDMQGARDQFERGVASFPNDFGLKVWWVSAEILFGGDPKIVEKILAAAPRANQMMIKPGEDPEKCNNKIAEAQARRVQITEEFVYAACSEGFSDPPEWVFAKLGMIDSAFKALDANVEKYFEADYLGRELFLPRLRELRADVRFMHVAARLGLVDYWIETGHWPDFCANEKLSYDCKSAAVAARDQLKAPNL